MDKGIEALIAKVKKQTESFDTVVLKEDEAKSLISALEQAQRNALRYQFLRDKDAFGDDEEPGLIGWDGLVELDANEFDAAIDARMAHPNIAYAPPHHNGMMQLSNELAEMKRKCAELEAASVKSVKLPMPYDINVAGERVDWAKGDNFDRDEVIEAIRAAGGTVAGGE